MMLCQGHQKQAGSRVSALILLDELRYGQKGIAYGLAEYRLAMKSLV
jgi:hypothetical protein